MHSCNITCPNCNKVLGGYRLEINELFQCQICGQELKFLGISEKCKVIGICEIVESGPKSKDWFSEKLDKAAAICDLIQSQAGDQENWPRADKSYVRLQSNNIENNLLLLTEYILEIEERNES